MRSYGWIGTEDLKDLPNTVNFILPEVIKATGIEWKIVGNMLHSQIVEMVLDRVTLGNGGEKALSIDNEVIRKLYTRFPVLDDDEIGYKIIDEHHFQSSSRVHLNMYLGFWAVNANDIYERGRVAGKKFGI